MVLFSLLFSSCTPTSNAALPQSAGAQPLKNTPSTATSPAASPSAAPAQPETPLPTQIAASPSPETIHATGTPNDGLYTFPENVNPLTGLVVDDPALLNRRPVMVKVSNYPRTGRPHAGLSFADMVFEYYIGYGLNRFMAIYLGQDCPQVGPVRSGRLVDAQLGELYQGLLFYGDADPQVDEVILKELGPRALAEKYIPSPPKYRIGEVLDETTLFVNTSELTQYVNQQAQVSNGRRDLRGMVFGDMIHPEHKPATNLGVQFWTTDRGEWHYDEKTGKYLRWIEDVKSDNEVEMIPLVDRLTNEQIGFSNVIILFATYIEYAPTLHDVQLYDNTAGKKALFFRDGVMVEGSWKTTSNGMPIQFFNSWGTPMQLKPGNTWIVLAGDASTFAEKDPGTWELRFDLP